MRTSGGTGRDHLMTAVPIGMLVLFGVFMAGGPVEALLWLEHVLRGLLEWATSIVR